MALYNKLNDEHCIAEPWVPEVFFRSEAAIVSGETAIERLSRGEKILITASPHNSLQNKNPSGTEGSIAVDWFKHNGLMANSEKFHSMTLCNTDQDF